MKKILVCLVLSFSLASNANTVALTISDKTNVAMSEASAVLLKDINELRTHVLENSLSALSGDSDIDHETETVIGIMEKKFPHKTQREILALLSSNLLSEPGKQ